MPNFLPKLTRVRQVLALRNVRLVSIFLLSLQPFLSTAFAVDPAPSLAALDSPDADPMALAVPGLVQLRILGPDLLEVTLTSTKAPDPARVDNWDFVDEAGQLRLPAPAEWTVLAQSRPMQVVRV